MTENICPKASINATISSKSVLLGSVHSSTILGNISLGAIEIVKRDLPNYEGDYEATPSVREQVFPTKDRSMREDFVVHKIPYFETSNPSGGYTAIIGG